MREAMPSLEEIQHQIAIYIAMFPPEDQANFLGAIALAYTSGYQACATDMRNASKSLVSNLVH
jgi:hypothetical protein